MFHNNVNTWFDVIRRALAQGVSDHRPLLHQRATSFFYGSQPKLDNFQSKNQHRATAAATVAVVVAVAAQIVVSCSKPGARGGEAVREPPDPEIVPHFCGG